MMKKALFIFVVLSILFSCKRDEDTRWDVEILSPVVKTRLTIDDLVGDSILSINPDNSVTLDYTFGLSPIDEDFFFEVPDTALKLDYGFPFLSPISLAPGFQFISDPAENEFNLNDAKIEYMEIESGKIEYKITSEIPEKTFYTYTIFKTNDRIGNVFRKTISVPAGTRTNPSITVGSFNLDGVSFDLTGSTGTKFNTFESEVLVNVDPAGNSVTVSNLDSVFIENKLIGIKPKYARGYLGQSSFSEGPTNNKFTVFDQIKGGTIDIDSLEIFTEVKNYVGAEAQLKLNQLISVNSQTGNSVALSHTSIGNWINLNRGTDLGTSIFPGKTRVDYTTQNSNIDLVIENLSDEMVTQVETRLNPLGNISSGNDFLYFDQVVEADFHIKLPLRLVANNLKFQQKIDLGIQEETNPVYDALISIYAENGFPFDAEVQLFLLDEWGGFYDSLVVTGLINSANTDALNKVTTPVNSVVKIAVPENKMNFLNTKNSEVILQIVFNTNSLPHTTIYRDYYLDLKLVTDMNAEIKYR